MELKIKDEEVEFTCLRYNGWNEMRKLFRNSLDQLALKQIARFEGFESLPTTKIILSVSNHTKAVERKMISAIYQSVVLSQNRPC